MSSLPFFYHVFSTSSSLMQAAGRRSARGACPCKPCFPILMQKRTVWRRSRGMAIVSYDLIYKMRGLNDILALALQNSIEGTHSMSSFRGVLLDIDGVLHVSMQPVAGAAETLQWLERQGYQTCFVTNTTTSSRATLVRSLQSIGLPLAEERVVTAPVATASYIRQHYPGKRCWLLTKGDTARDFAGIELVDSHADLVVVGGAEELLTYENMNHAFRMLMDGAVLLATHTNLYWRTSEGLQLDSGPYVHALEVATGQRAMVLGKPNMA